MTKWRVQTTSRCSRSGWPQFRVLGISSNTSSDYDYDYDYPLHNNASTDYGHIYFYSSKQRKWIKYECNAIDPFDSTKKRMEFTSIIQFQGKFYALSLQGSLAVIEFVDSRLAMTEISTRRAVPSVHWKLFKEHLFEINGDIFLLFFIHNKSTEIVEDVEVFGLCLDGLKWIKIERLEGKTVFIDRRCSWVNSVEIGCRGDCIYFTQGQAEEEEENNSWWIYNMETNCISHASSVL